MEKKGHFSLNSYNGPLKNLKDGVSEKFRVLGCLLAGIATPLSWHSPFFFCGSTTKATKTNPPIVGWLVGWWVGRPWVALMVSKHSGHFFLPLSSRN